MIFPEELYNVLAPEKDNKSKNKDKREKNSKYSEEDLDNIMRNIRYRDFDRLIELDFTIIINDDGVITLDIRDKNKGGRGKPIVCYEFGKTNAMKKTFQIRMNDLTKDFTFRCPIELH